MWQYRIERIVALSRGSRANPPENFACTTAVVLGLVGSAPK
jgi:hypothetical protein